MDGLDLGDDDGMGEWVDDLNLRDDIADEEKEEVDEMDGMTDMGDSLGGSVFPKDDRPTAAPWTTNSPHAPVHSAIGAASSARQLLNSQIDVANFTKLRNDGMIGNYLGAFASVPGVGGSVI